MAIVVEWGVLLVIDLLASPADAAEPDDSGGRKDSWLQLVTLCDSHSMADAGVDIRDGGSETGAVAADACWDARVLRHRCNVDASSPYIGHEWQGNEGEHPAESIER